MKTIWKFPIRITDFQAVEMPVGAVILSCQVQGLTPRLWAIVDTCTPREPRGIFIAGTGNPLPDLSSCRFIDTIQTGAFVWHVFEAVPHD